MRVTACRQTDEHHVFVPHCCVVSAVALVCCVCSALSAVGVLARIVVSCSSIMCTSVRARLFARRHHRRRHRSATARCRRDVRATDVILSDKCSHLFICCCAVLSVLFSLRVCVCGLCCAGVCRVCCCVVVGGVCRAVCGVVLRYCSVSACLWWPSIPLFSTVCGCVGGTVPLRAVVWLRAVPFLSRLCVGLLPWCACVRPTVPLCLCALLDRHRCFSMPSLLKKRSFCLPALRKYIFHSGC